MANEALSRAIEAVGGQNELARRIGVPQQNIWQWLHKNKRGTPAEHVLKVEAASGVSRHDLRPDVYPVEDSARPAA